MHILKKLTFILIALSACLSLSAQNKKQEEKDSLVVLLSSKSAQMVDVEGARYRKVIGPARFLHNNTYLICDTALWNVESQIIDAWGHVSILQEETVLTSDNLQYLIEADLAKFRGSVVQLTDKDHNTLRTRFLDYNTKDSVAVFLSGGAMRDKDGQIIESRTGTYDSKINTFTFENDVNMFTDSIFVKTTDLVYNSDQNMATFGKRTDAWKDENMLSANSGWYDREREIFFFSDNVHVMTEDQEGWSDSLYFYRNTQDVEMLGNAQITDTTRNVFALAGRLHYIDTLSKVTLTRDPAVISEMEEKDGSIDTVYLGADRLVYHTIKKCDIPESVIKDSQTRLDALSVDPVGEFRRKAAQEAAKAAEEAAKNDPNRPPQLKGGAGPKGGQTRGPAKPKLSAAPPMVGDSLARRPAKSKLTAPVAAELEQIPASDSLVLTDSRALSDSLVLSDSLALADSLGIADSLALADSLAGPLDTTKIGFLEAVGKVRIYKKNMQVVCDSLQYCDLDSLARLYESPLIWQEITRQYSADSVTVVIKDGAMDKASLMSNAFIVIQEDSVHFDQIKGAEMLAFFDANGDLKRFDVLGGASAMFYLEENGTLATVNKTDSKMLSAVFKNGEIQRVYYFEQPKNDGYPVVQLGSEESQLKGFNWQPERRPADRFAVTPLSLRPSERSSYEARPRTEFRQTDIYFPGYMDDVYRQMEVRDSLRRIREFEKAHPELFPKPDTLAFQTDSLMVPVDTLAAPSDTLAVTAESLLVSADSLSAPSEVLLAPSDSVAVQLPVDVPEEIVVPKEENIDLPVEPKPEPTPEELEAKRKAEAERQKAAAKAEKERIKAEKQKLKDEKRAAQEEKKRLKQEERELKWAELDKRDADKAASKEAKRLEKERRNKRKALEDAARQAEKDAAALEKFRQKYEKRKAKEDAKAAKKAAKKAASRNK